MDMEQMELLVAAAPAISAPQPFGDILDRGQTSSEVYCLLTGCHPRDALIDNDINFDRHVLACILSASAAKIDALPERAGLGAGDLASLMARWFPVAAIRLAWRASDETVADDETAMVRDLLLSQRSTAGDTGRFLAAMVARRAMEPNHLWEDLGLRDRSELTRLLKRHFAPLAERNTKNMRWKRFFYRALCESDGFVMCTTPVCTDCGDFAICFGDEDGESRMAERRRATAHDERSPAQT